MQGFIPNELTNAVHATLRVANELSHGSRVYPYSESVKREEVRARRGPKPLQWLIERETFETAVAEQYTQLQNGVVRELIAGTGVGKTTRLPLVLARTHRVNGIVLMPHATYAMRTFSYVASRVQAEGGDVNVVLLRSMHVKTPPTSPVVYFTDADTFLGRLARTPTLIRDLGLDFIFLDESHSGTPGYTFFRYAVAANIVSGCKVFYGTATASADVSMESTKAIQKVDSKVLSIDNPRSATGNSPLHYTRIQDKTIVMLANDQEIDQWFHYYNDHDIPVYRCTMAGGDTVEMAADKFVASHALCVLLVTGKFRTSVTLDVDTVIDGGYQTVVTTDFGERTVSLRRIPISEALRVQSMGRVNRFKPGRGFYADIEYSTQSNDDNDDNAFYVFLWAIVFNLKINEPSISMFNDLFSTPLTRVNAAHLLHCRVPPFLMVPYIGDEGFYRGWHNVGKFVLFQHGIDCYDEAPVDTSSWVEYNTGPVTYSSSPIVYKSMVRYPREWDVLPAYAWSAHQGEDINIRMLRAASVISAAPTMRTAKPTNASRLSVNTVASHDTVGTLWTDGRTPKASVNDVTHNAPRVAPALRRDSVGSGLPAVNKELALPGLPFIQSAYSVRDSLPAIKQIPVHTRNNSVEEIPRNPIDEWQRNTSRDMVPGSAYLQRVNSESSDERHQIDLRSVNPVKYKQFKLYPMDPSAFTVFAQREAANIHDKDRVVKLLHGSVNIANLHGETTTRKDKQTAYFLSVLRVHNAAVVHSAQLAAHQNPGILSRLRIGFNGSMQTVDKDIDETAGLLKAFMIEGFFVGVDKRARRSQDSFSMYTPDYDYEEAKAKIMLSFGAQGVVNIIGKLVRLSRPVYYEDKYLANAWQLQDVVFTVQHPFEDRDFLPEWARHVVEKPDDDDVIVFAAKTVTDSTIAMRDAINNESVYAVTYDVAKEQAVVLGDYDVRVIGSTLYITTDLAKGASGALIVAVSDGAVLGIYVGYFGHIGDVQCSVVVPSAVLRKYIG